LDEHLIAVGHVAVRAGMLDKMIEMTAEQVFLQYPKTIRKEGLRFSTPKKLQVVQDALVQELAESEHAISEFIQEVDAARSERNDIIHKIWRGTEAVDTKELVEMRRGEPEKSIRRVTAKSMMALATKMIDLTFEMADWKMRSNQVRQRRFASSRGIRPPLPALPTPPRTSSLDLEKRRRPGPRPLGS
jgi:hypothetical protein